MTTISYNHKDKEIAVDSRTTAGDTIVSDTTNKVDVVDGKTFITSGTVGEDIKLIEAYLSNSDQNIFLDANAIVIDKGEVFKIGMTEENGLWVNRLNYSFAMGNGWQWAMAAMDFGKTAKQAVEYAKTRDIYTGGKVRVIKVK